MIIGVVQGEFDFHLGQKKQKSGTFYWPVLQFFSFFPSLHLLYPSYICCVPPPPLGAHEQLTHSSPLIFFFFLTYDKPVLFKRILPNKLAHQKDEKKTTQGTEYKIDISESLCTTTTKLAHLDGTLLFISALPVHLLHRLCYVVCLYSSTVAPRLFK